MVRLKRGEAVLRLDYFSFIAMRKCRPTNYTVPLSFIDSFNCWYRRSQNTVLLPALWGEGKMQDKEKLKDN